MSILLDVLATLGQSISHSFTTGSGTETAPAGRTSCRIRIYGGGGGGGWRSSASLFGGGAGGGAFSEKTVSVTPGDQCAYVVGAGGARGGTTGSDGSDGSQSSATGSTGGFTGIAMTAGGGKLGKGLTPFTAGVGGSALGGTTNTSGGNAAAEDGGAAPGPDGGLGGIGASHIGPGNYGGGGCGGDNTTNGGFAGAGGYVVFDYF